MSDILVIRHAESVWNCQGRWQGHADPPLSASGAALAKAAGAHLGDVVCIVSSDLIRAEQTARNFVEGRALAQGAEAVPVTVDGAWRERDVGLWQGLTTAEINRDFPGALARSDYPQGWESDESLLARVLPAAEGLRGAVGEGTGVVVSHAGVLYALERYFGVEFERFGNLSGRRFVFASEGLRLAERVTLSTSEAGLPSPASMEER